MFSLLMSVAFHHRQFYDINVLIIVIYFAKSHLNLHMTSVIIAIIAFFLDDLRSVFLQQDDNNKG